MERLAEYLAYEIVKRQRFSPIDSTDQMTLKVRIKDALRLIDKQDLLKMLNITSCKDCLEG